jgi:hypothetical protein
MALPEVRGWARFPVRVRCRRHLHFRVQMALLEVRGWVRFPVRARKSFHLLLQLRTEPTPERVDA